MLKRGADSQRNLVRHFFVLMVVLLLGGCGTATTGGEGGGSGETSTQESPGTGQDPTQTEGAAEFDEVHLRFASMIPEGNSFMESVDWWAQELQDRSGGAISVEVFYAESLLAGPEIMPGVQDGTVETGLLAGAYHPQEMPLFNTGTLPFLSDNAVALALAYSNLYDSSEALQAEFASQDLVPLYWLPAGPTVVGSATPLETLEDFNGKRFRSVGWVNSAVSALGADPVGMGAGEMYESIQRGVLDGAAGVTFDVYPALGLHEVAPHVVDTGLGVFNTVAVIANADVLDGLSASTLDLIDEVSREVEREQAATILADAESAACSEILDGGGEVTSLPDSERNRWNEMIESSVRQEWLDQLQQAGIENPEAESFYDELVGEVERVESEVDYINGMAVCADRTSE